VSPAASDLPDDPAALKALAMALKAQLQARDLIIETLRSQLAALRRARFGASSEKLDRQIEQLELRLTDLEETTAQESARAEAAQPGASEPAKRRPRGPRKPLPEHLPREVIRHEPPTVCPCCGGTKLSVVGEDVREVLEPKLSLLPIDSPPITRLWVAAFISIGLRTKLVLERGIMFQPVTRA
jgi:transposase